MGIVPLDVTGAVRWCVRDENIRRFEAPQNVIGCLFRQDALGQRAGNVSDLESESQDVHVPYAYRVSVKEMYVRAISECAAQFIEMIVISRYDHHWRLDLLEQRRRVGKTLAMCGEVSGADNEIRFSSLRSYSLGNAEIAVKVAEGKNVHLLNSPLCLSARCPAKYRHGGGHSSGPPPRA
jgi:hypothetical protein